MYDPKEFYKGFQLNYFDYKQISNKHLLELPDEEVSKLIKPVLQSKISEFRQNIKLDIRLTFLLSLETLFELIYALLPDKNGKMNDENIMLKLSQKSLFNEDLRKFANNEKSIFNKLDAPLFDKTGQKSFVLRHIFFFGLFKPKIEKNIKNSCSTILQILKKLARELSDRRELNSFKHGFRGVRFMETISFQQVDDPDKKLKFNLKDSITVYNFNKQQSKHEFLTKPLDFQRDINLTHLTSNLIGNIIVLRKAIESKEKNLELPIHFFPDSLLVDPFKSNVDLTHINFSYDVLNKNEI